MTKRKKLSISMLLPGLFILGYYWKVLYDRGIYADVNGTAGYTTGLEIALIVLGLILFITGLTLFVMSDRVKSPAPKTNRLPYFSAGLFFAAAIMFLGVPGATKYIATPIFLIVAGINLVAGRKAKG